MAARAPGADRAPETGVEATTRHRLPHGKLPPGLLRELLADERPAPEVLLGPALGEDACALRVEGGTLVAATDPITMTGSAVGRHAVYVNANDVAVMGVEPRWFLAAVLLPPGTAAADVRALFAEMRAALATLGALLVGGHTEVTPAVRQPVVVGQMLGLSPAGGYVPTGGLGAGDVVLQVGPAPVEGAAVLAESVPRARLASVAPELLAAAARAVERPGILVVEPALIAARAGAKALHDPTEGGLATALREMADASGVRLEVSGAGVQWFTPGVALCQALGLDPWGTLASGALLAGFAPERAGTASAALRAAGYSVSVLAAARAGSGVYLDGRPAPSFERDEIARLAEAG